MSDGSFRGSGVLRDLDQRRLTTEEATQLLGLEHRQVFRLLKAYRTEGATGLISKRRGRPSNRRKPEELRDKALAIIREQYWDFGPTLAAEKLREGHAIALGRETLRLWMIGAGIWADREQRRKHIHHPRYRRECVGELVRFAKLPANKKDLHRPLRAGDDLEDAFAWKEERTLSQALTLQYDKVIFIVEPSELAKAAIGKRVSVVDYPDGRLMSSCGASLNVAAGRAGAISATPVFSKSAELVCELGPLRSLGRGNGCRCELRCIVCRFRC